MPGKPIVIQLCPFQELRARSYRLGYRDSDLADKLGLSRPSISSRMTGKKPWRPEEIATLCDLLGIPREEIGEYFFPEVKSRKEIEDEES